MKSTFMNDICRALVIWTIVMFSFCVVEILVGCRMLVESHDFGHSYWQLSMSLSLFVKNCEVYIAGGWCFCRWQLLFPCIWTTSDLLHSISDLCGFCVPANIRTTLRRNTETKRSWSTVMAAQTSTGKNTKRKTRTKRRGEKRRFVLLWKTQAFSVNIILMFSHHNISICILWI